MGGYVEGTDTLFVYIDALFRLTYILMNDNTDSTSCLMKKMFYSVKNSVTVWE